MTPPHDLTDGGDVATLATVLLVNSDIIVRSALAAYLRDCGYRVVEAADADEAMRLLDAQRVPVEVVFTAIGAGGEAEGFTLAQWVRRERPGLEVVIAGSPARAAGAAGDLCEDGQAGGKPSDPRGILAEIQRLIASRPKP